MRSLFSVVLCVLLALPALAQEGSLSVPNCTFTARGFNVKFDLSRLVRFFQMGDFVGHGAQYDYVMNICEPSRTGRCHDMGAGLCQLEKGTGAYHANVGFWSGPQPVWRLLDGHDPKQGLHLQFQNGDPCVIGDRIVPRRVDVNLQCIQDHTPPVIFNVQEDLNTCHFIFTMATHQACPMYGPPLPYLPSNYRATLEITVMEHMETLWLHEVHDWNKKKVRQDQYFHPGGWTTTLIDYGHHERYSVINGTTCFRHHLPPDIQMHSLFDMLRDHKDRLVYQGVYFARGVLCDMWEGHWVATSHDGITYFEDAIWFFARPDWPVIENPNLYRRPVSVFLRSNYTRSHLASWELHAIQFFEYQDNLDARAEREVELRPEWNCPGGPTPPPRPDNQGAGGMDSGSVAGLSIFMIALGGAFGVGGLWYYQKRRGTYTVASTAMGHGAF